MATNVMAASQGRSFGFDAHLRRALVYAVAAVGVSSTAWAVEDPSLTAAEYESLGMPAADRTWGATEYEAAASALGKLAASSPERLARREPPPTVQTRPYPKKKSREDVDSTPIEQGRGLAPP